LGCFGPNKKKGHPEIPNPCKPLNVGELFLGVLYNSIPKEGPVQSKQGSIRIPCLQTLQVQDRKNNMSLRFVH